MKIKYLSIVTLALLVIATLAVGCTTTNIYVPSSTPEIALDQATIDEALEQCQGKTGWGINPPAIRSGYVTGVEIEGAVVLHNGNDAERLIVLTYNPIYTEKLDADTGIYYQPAPPETRSWVTIDDNFIRLGKMEDQIVRIHLLVPETYKIEQEYWEFRINASGIIINEYTRELANVVTVEQDTSLSVRLDPPLLLNDIYSVKNITSSIDEELYVSSYDPNTQTLIIGGLKESETREITITYEFRSMVETSYNQRWLIKML